MVIPIPRLIYSWTLASHKLQSTEVVSTAISRPAFALRAIGTSDQANCPILKEKSNIKAVLSLLTPRLLAYKVATRPGYDQTTHSRSYGDCLLIVRSR